jgi:hypothetical protein
VVVPPVVVVPAVVAAPPAVITPATVAVPAAKPRPPVALDEGTQVANPPPPPSLVAGDRGCATTDPNESVTPLPSEISDGVRRRASEPSESAAPIVITATTHRRGSEPTDIVAPLPPPLERARASSTPLVIVEPGLAEPEASVTSKGADRRRWIVAGAMGGVALVTVILVVVIGFSGSGMAREPRPARRVPIATMPREVVPQPPAPPMNPQVPERAVATESLHEPTPPTDVAAHVQAPPPPAEPPAEIETQPDTAVPAPAGETHRPARPRSKVGPVSSSATRKPAQVARPTTGPPSSPPAKPRPPTYDPDALFLKKP